MDENALLHPSPVRGTLGQRVEQLVASLPGVVSIRARVGEGGELDAVDVRVSDRIRPYRMARAIQSALLIYLDVEIEEDRISVDETEAPPPEDEDGGRAGRVPSSPLHGSGSAEGEGAGAREHRRGSEEGAGTPPAHDRAPSVDAPGEPEPPPRPAGAVSGQAPGVIPDDDRSPGPAAPVQVSGYRIQGGGEPGVRVSVHVEARGSVFYGSTSASDLDSVGVEVFAEAATMAAGQAIRRAFPDRSAPDLKLRARGVEEVEAFGRPHVAVAMSGLTRRRQRTGVGFAEIDPENPDPHRAAAVAAVDAALRVTGGRWLAADERATARKAGEHDEAG